MPSPPPLRRLAINNTVKLPVALQRRVLSAMQVEGYTIWSEFCRVALMEKCHLTEDRLRARDLVEFQRMYPESSRPVPVRRQAAGRKPAP